MPDTGRESLRTTFGQDAELYDRCRPTYPAQLFTGLATLADLGPRSRVLEIGRGTGQATLPLAHLGCDVVAMDLSPDMAAIARRNLAPFPNVTVVAAAFEDWQPPDGTLDSIVSATAFHWLDPDDETPEEAAEFDRRDSGRSSSGATSGSRRIRRPST